MKRIRKIWVGTSIKGQDTMSWELGQKIRLNKEATEYGIIECIHKIDDGYEISVKQDNVIRVWKKAITIAAVEYDLSFT